VLLVKPVDRYRVINDALARSAVKPQQESAQVPAVLATPACCSGGDAEGTGCTATGVSDRGSKHKARRHSLLAVQMPCCTACLRGTAIHACMRRTMHPEYFYMHPESGRPMMHG